MNTLNDLADYVDALARRVPVAANEAKQQVTSTILTDLATITPADVGTAISNWQVSTEAPNLANLPAHSPSPKGRFKNGSWQHAVDPLVTIQNNAPATIEIAQPIIDGATPSQPLFISNGLPYIEVLNDGSSSQAPAGFVDRALILARSVIDKFKISL